MAMFRQLGPPTFFFTQSCAVIEWTELLINLLRLQRHEDGEAEEILYKLSFEEKCDLRVRKDPVTTALYCEHKFAQLLYSIYCRKIFNG